MQVWRRLCSFLVCALVAAGVVVAAPNNAFAGYHNNCYTYDVCYWWDDSPAFTQSRVGVAGGVADVANPWITFQTSGSGQGQGISNNAGSIQNWDYQLPFSIWVDQNYGGACDYMAPSGSLSGWFVTQNNNRAQSMYC